MHLCDNPTCVRHIAAGTHVENMAGAVLRGRVRRGEDKPTAVFTNEEVSKMLQLYSEGVRVRDLAIAFSGKRGTIHNIVHQNSWKFLSRDYKIEKRHKGSGHYKARVTEDDVRKIRHLKSSGYTLKQLGKQFGLTIPALSLIVNRKNWTHVE